MRPEFGRYPNEFHNVKGKPMNTFVLQVVNGSEPGQEIVFNEPIQIVIGRSRTCVLRVFDRTVSRQHCLLDLTETPSVRDLGSLNGTFVNGVQIGTARPDDSEATLLESGPVPLQEGDELRLGGCIFRVRRQQKRSVGNARSGIAMWAGMAHAGS